MVTQAAQVFQSLGTKRPGDEGYRPDLDANFNSDFVEYATPERSLVDTGFYVTDRGLPWHVKLSRAMGTRELMDGVSELLKGDEAYAAAGGFETELRPVTDPETGLILPDKFLVRRVDTKDLLGVVGRSWKGHQEREIIEFCDTIVDDGQGKYETGGHMRDGKWFFVSMELNHLEISIPGDPSSLKTYLLARTAHDGSRPTGFFLTQVRDVCTNTENLAVKGAISQYRIYHRGTLDGKVAEARKALRIAFKNTEIVKGLTKQLAKTKIVDAQVLEILKAAWPVDEAREGDEAVEVKNRSLDQAFELYQASPNLEGIRGTAWGAYNAITEYVDHGMKYHGRFLDDGDVRATSLLEGIGANTKKRALVAALGLKK